MWALRDPDEGPSGRDILWEVYSPEGEVVKDGWVRDPKTANDSSLKACKAFWKQREEPETSEDPLRSTARKLLHWNDDLPEGIVQGGRAGAIIYLQDQGLSLEEALNTLDTL